MKNGACIYRWILLVLAVSCSLALRPQALGDYVWIKDLKSDRSDWPKGFPQVPQPGHNGDVAQIDGTAETASDTAFDAVMRSRAGANTTVLVGPGLFKTRGAVGNVSSQSDSPGFRLQDHSRLIGAGKGGAAQNGTTLLLVACNQYFGAVVVGANEFDFWDDDGFAYTSASDIWVTDLEVDCNGPELSKVPESNPPVFDTRHPWYVQGVQMWGTGSCHIERVHVKNAVGADNTQPITEDFILCINSPPGVSLNNVIADCSVTDFYNPTGMGSCSAISMNRWDENAGSIHGIIRSCEVVLNGDRGWGYGGEFAYNASSAWGLVITNCTAKGAQRGFNNDTFPNYRIALTGNRFEMPPGVCAGILLLEPNRWSRFCNNTIVLTGAGSSGFLIDRAAEQGNDILLDNNTVIASGADWLGTSWSYNLNDNFRSELIPVNVHLEHNRVVTASTARLTTLVPGSVGFMTGNTVNGAAWLWPIMQPHLGWTYAPARADFLQDGVVDILLQDPAKYIYAYSLLGSQAKSPTTIVPSQPLPAGWQIVGTGDIDLDGKTDLLLNHPQFGLGYWLMDGTTCIEAGAITYQGEPCVLDGSWKVVAVADFNADGKPDLLLQDAKSFVGIWHLNGSEVLDMKLLSRNPVAGTSAGQWSAVGTGDFNGDGKPDILFQYDLEADPTTDGQLAVWYLDDFTVLGTGILDPVRPADPKNRVVATGDFYRSCGVDILFQHKTVRDRWGGALLAWSMDPVNRSRRLTESSVNLNTGSLNVIGPR